MKYTLAIAALLGSASAVTISKHRNLVNLQEASEMEFRPNVVQQPWAAKPVKPEDRAKITKVTDALTVNDDGSAYYTRKMPVMYSEERDDRLMWSLIKQYSVEGVSGPEKKPNGHFFMMRKDMEKVAREVVQTHFGFTANKREFYLRDNLPKLWGYYDLLDEGFIEASKAHVLLHHLVKDSDLNNGL